MAITDSTHTAHSIHGHGNRVWIDHKIAMKSNRGRVWQLLKYTWLHNEIENKQRVDNQPQLRSEWTGGIKAVLVKFCVLLTRDVLPWRANNSANDQDSLQEFLKWSEQITIEFVTEKTAFPSWRLIRLHHRFLCDVSLGNLEKWQRVGESSGP